MPAESGMIRRLRAWREAENEKQRELAYWVMHTAQAMQNYGAGYQGQSIYQAQSQQQNAAQSPPPWGTQQACSQLELLKLAARGSRRETKPLSIFGLGSLWE